MDFWERFYLRFTPRTRPSNWNGIKRELSKVHLRLYADMPSEQEDHKAGSICFRGFFLKMSGRRITTSLYSLAEKIVFLCVEFWFSEYFQSLVEIFLNEKIVSTKWYADYLLWLCVSSNSFIVTQLYTFVIPVWWHLDEELTTWIRLTNSQVTNNTSRLQDMYIYTVPFQFMSFLFRIRQNNGFCTSSFNNWWSLCVLISNIYMFGKTNIKINEICFSQKVKRNILKWKKCMKENCNNIISWTL